MKIDTEYKSLDEIDPVVVGYYSEEKRKRVTGHTDEEEPKPIYEDYTVIVLNKPDTVLYSEVAKRKGERKSESIVMAELDRAIEWEEFHFDHDLYLKWKEDYAKWTEEQPTEIIDDEPVLLSAPTQPVIDLSVRRAYYKVIDTPPTSIYYKVLSTFDSSFDDNKREELRAHHVQDLTKAQISDMHSDMAFKTRCDATYKPITITLQSGKNAEFDIGVGKDGVKGIENIKDAILLFQVAVSEEPIYWILTDNSLEPLVVADLNAVMVEFSRRKKQIFASYAAWRAGDKQKPFIIS